MPARRPVHGPASSLLSLASASPLCSVGGVCSRVMSQRFTAEERHRILLTCNQPEFAPLPPARIVLALADRSVFIGSERSFYRLLHAPGQAHRRGCAWLPQEPRPVPRLEARGPSLLWSGDITYLPASVRGVWLFLYLVIDVWSRKVVAWDVAEREEAQIGRSGGRRLPSRADQQRPPPDVDPPCRQRQCPAPNQPRISAGGAGGAQVLLQAQGQQRLSSDIRFWSRIASLKRLTT